jgi:hypothetical protein
VLTAAAPSATHADSRLLADVADKTTLTAQLAEELALLTEQPQNQVAPTGGGRDDPPGVDPTGAPYRSNLSLVKVLSA